MGSKIIQIFLLLVLLLTCSISVDAVEITSSTFKSPIGRILDTSWIAQKTLKYGMVGSFCTAQALTGVTEGYHWTKHSNYGGEYLVHSSNYHTFETMRRGAWVVTGVFAYANVRDAEISKWGKVRRFVGSAMLARNCMEFGYRYQRYGNPFDYSANHNKSSLVYFGIRNGKVVDLYIGTGPFSGPLVDSLFLLGGLLLLQD